MRVPTRRKRSRWPFLSVGLPLTSKSSSLYRCAAPIGKISSKPFSSVWSSTPWDSPGGAPVVTGEKTGAFSRLVCYCKAAGYTQPIHKVCYIIYQEALYGGSATLVDVTCVMVKVIKSIPSCSFN